jgi:hypothetical protein
MVESDRCGLLDRILPEGSSARRERNIDIKRVMIFLCDRLRVIWGDSCFFLKEDPWTKDDFTYGIRNYTMNLEKSTVGREIVNAFWLWEEVTPLTFSFVKRGNVDIEIR